jgi:hypothetical protein
MLKNAFGGEIISRTETFNWFSNFKSGVTSDSNAERAGQPRTWIADDDLRHIKERVHEDKHVTICNLADELGISLWSCQSILVQGLNMWQIATKLMPHLLTDMQKQNCVRVCQGLKENTSERPTITFVDHHMWQNSNWHRWGGDLRTIYRSWTGTGYTCLVQNTSANDPNDSAVTRLTVSSLKGATWKGAVWKRGNGREKV